MLVYTWKEWLPWLNGFLVSLLKSKRLLLSVSLCTVSRMEKQCTAEKCHLNLMFCMMWLKLSTTLKYMSLNQICLCNSVKRWTQSTRVFFHTQKLLQFSHSVVSNSLWPHGLQHTRPPCPSPTPGVYPNSCPLSLWCHPIISSSVVPFSSCPQFFPASGSFQISQLFHIRWPKYWSFSFNISPSTKIKIAS